MAKIKLLYDIEQLLVSVGQETGICRMSFEVLKEISKRPEYEVYPVVTTQKGQSPEKYLRDNGLGYLIPNIVDMPLLKKTTQSYSLYKKIRGWFLMKKHASQYIERLKQYDEYISLFSPISPIVYKSRIKTKIIIHDLIPLLLPQTCTPLFVKKFRSWIQQLSADEVIFDSQSTLNDFLKFRPDYRNKKTKVAYLAADSKFKPTYSKEIFNKYHISTPRYFLAVSGYHPRKNFTHTLDSFIEFLKKTNATDISLVFTGPNGHGYEKLQAQIQTYPQFKDKIVCTGFVAEEDMFALYSQAEAFLYPSLYEGFGLPVLESMQCGTPVITCRNSSLPEVGGDAALYVSETDTSEMANTMVDLYTNSQKREEISQQGIRHASQFGWDKTVKQIFDLK